MKLIHLKTSRIDLKNNDLDSNQAKQLLVYLFNSGNPATTWGKLNF